MKTAGCLIIALTMTCLAPIVSFGAELGKIKHLTTIYADQKGGELKNPDGVACNESSLVVADSGNGRLVRYALDGDSIKGGDEIRPTQLANPIRVQLAVTGDIYAFDGKSRRILRINQSGAFQGYLEPQGVPAPAFMVSAFKIGADGRFYLLDIFAERVLVLDQGGKFLSQLPFPTGFGFMVDVAVGGKGTIYLADSTNGIIYAAAPDAKEFAPLVKNLREYLSFPGYITTDSRGTIHVVDENGGGLVSFGQEGAFISRQLGLGRKNGLLYYPGQICIGPQGVFIADRDNSRVQLFENIK